MFRANFALRMFTSAVLAALLATPAAWAVVIDDFSQPTPLFQTLNSGPGPMGGAFFGPLGPDVFVDPSIIGGSRTATLEGFHGLAQDVVLRIGSGVADFQAGTLSHGVATLSYGGDLSALAGNTIITVDIIAFDDGITANASILSIFVNDGTNNATIAHDLTDDILGGSVDFDFTLSGVDFSSLVSVILTFDTTTNLATSADLTLGGITARSVPEPASIALWTLMGLAGIGYRARRRMAKK